jgi:hypothetical protein
MKVTGTAVFVWTLSALCGTALGIITLDYLRAPVRSDFPSPLAKPDTASRDTTKPPEMSKPAPEPPIKETPSPKVNKAPATEPAIKETPSPQIDKAPVPESATIDTPNPQKNKAVPDPPTVEKKEVPSRPQNETEKQGKRTKFRGIGLGMTRSEIEEALPQEFMLHDPGQSKQTRRPSPKEASATSRATIVPRRVIGSDPYRKAVYASRREGSVAFDSNQMANRLELRSSFLGIQKRMRWGEFREWLDEKYDITWTEEKELTRQPIGDGGFQSFGNGGYKETRRRLGTLESGERIEAIYEKYVNDAQGTVESFKVQITPRLR